MIVGRNARRDMISDPSGGFRPRPARLPSAGAWGCAQIRCLVGLRPFSNGGLVNDDDVRLSDDEELPDAALVRPYVESLGEFATSSQAPDRPSLTASEQPTTLLPRISLTIRKHGARALAPRPVDSSWQDEPRPVDASPVDEPPTRSHHRARLAIAAVVTVLALVGGYFIWGPSRDASETPGPSSGAASSVPLPSTISSPSLTATQSTGTPAARPSVTPSARSSKSAAPFGPGPQSPDPSGNLALGRPVDDTGHNDSHVASNAVDGNPNTYWESTNRAFPQSITVDLGAPRTIDRMVVRLPPLQSWDKRNQWISISCGQIGGDFRSVDGLAILKFNPANGNQATVRLHSPSCRYVRLTFMANTGAPAGQASEIELYAS